MAHRNLGQSEHTQRSAASCYHLELFLTDTRRLKIDSITKAITNAPPRPLNSINLPHLCLPHIVETLR